MKLSLITTLGLIATLFSTAYASGMQEEVLGEAEFSYVCMETMPTYKVDEEVPSGIKRMKDVSYMITFYGDEDFATNSDQRTNVSIKRTTTGFPGAFKANKEMDFITNESFALFAQKHQDAVTFIQNNDQPEYILTLERGEDEKLRLYEYDVEKYQANGYLYCWEARNNEPLPVAE